MLNFIPIFLFKISVSYVSLASASSFASRVIVQTDPKWTCYRDTNYIMFQDIGNKQIDRAALLSITACCDNTRNKKYTSHSPYDRISSKR